MIIEAIRVTVEPIHYKDPPITKLDIRVKIVPGGEVGLQKTIPTDDLRSMWDYIWDAAGEQLKKAMQDVEGGNQ